MNTGSRFWMKTFPFSISYAVWPRFNTTIAPRTRKIPASAGKVSVSPNTAAPAMVATTGSMDAMMAAVLARMRESPTVYSR